jgi:hypothetical protein
VEIEFNFNVNAILMVCMLKTLSPKGDIAIVENLIS